MNIGDKYYIPLTRKKRILIRPKTRVWYLNTYGQEEFDYALYKNIIRNEGEDDKIVATLVAIYPDYVELKLENRRILSVHYEYLDKLEKFN